MLERLGKYEILETIAAGGQGTVYRARDGESGDVVALKVMHPGHTGEVQYLEALRQEANLASRLDHPNIVKVLDFQVEGGTAFVAMEYVPGVLRSEMRPRTPLSHGKAVELAIQVASAMAHAHQHGVVHRDIKPQNILLTEDGTVKVTDFGIARAMQSSSIIRQTGVMGTPHYMSPEQWQGRAVDGRADVYSLGIVLYEMLTGSPPFEGDGMGEIFRKHEQEPVPPLPQELEVPEWLESVIRRALEKEASARFSSAGGMLEALEQEVVVEGRTAILPVRVSKVPVAASVAGVGLFATLVSTAAVLAATGQASGQVLGILVLIAGLGAIGGGAGLSKWGRFPGWYRGLAGVGVLGILFGAVTLINPSMTGLSVGINPPVSESVMVIPFDVLPDEPNTFSYPPGGVTVELPAGTVNQPTEFLYTFLEVESVPARLEGFTLTDRVFDLSLVGTDGRTLEGPVTLGQPIKVSVRIDTRHVALAGGDESRVFIQHYHQEEGWEVLETAVDFASSVASAQVERLSVFALTVKEPEPPPALAAAATAIPSPTAMPAPPPHAGGDSDGGSLTDRHPDSQPNA